MAEDEDGVSDKKSPQNSNNSETNDGNQPSTSKPDLGIEEAKYDTKENGHKSPTEPSCSSSKTGAMRKEDNPFSFRHFLKRDLSLPGNSTYENTGARPKVYANTVQHSPTRLDKIDIHSDSRRDKNRSNENKAKEKKNDLVIHRSSEDASSSSSVEIPFSVVEESESKHNYYADSSDGPFFHRPNLASEPLGMPSLPDFVQDHILVEQAYLNSNGPISVDLDNLPDFTYTNSNYNAGSSSSLGRRNKNSYGGNRNYDYDAYLGAASTSAESGPSNRSIPLDLPVGAEAAPPPLDLVHLNLDLTESVNPADRRNVSPRNNFPLDLPPNAGAESMRLPDFLPVHPGRTSPEPQAQNEQIQQLVELERTRSELFMERNRRLRAEEELNSGREALRLLRAELSTVRAAETALRNQLSDVRLAETALRTQLSDVRLAETALRTQLSDVRLNDDGVHREHNLLDVAARPNETDSTVAELKNEIKRLQEELSSSQEEVRTLRAASTITETSLRELLSNLERLRTQNRDPT
ncbi:uncharacterized protein LOC123694163 [Colias croceus]|uniref:uncharacterized protein LOC123694163 n=1 Tax=Colias crocea TaxID=72248 RepID=UPI001E280141|nr:uncharacterized protein LOC123694163 [Colias croceus]